MVSAKCSIYRVLSKRSTLKLFKGWSIIYIEQYSKLRSVTLNVLQEVLLLKVLQEVLLTLPPFSRDPIILVGFRRDIVARDTLEGLLLDRTQVGDALAARLYTLGQAVVGLGTHDVRAITLQRGRVKGGWKWGGS